MPFRMLPLLFSFVFLCVGGSIAQISISGKVVSNETGLPIAGASVYFNNTSIGTSSNAAGEFSFSSINLMNTELVVSSIGYEVFILRPDAATANGKYFLCRLQIKEQQLREVLIMPDLMRRKWLNIFKNNFLGITEEAARSNVVNLADIYFTRGVDNNAFNAYSDTPLVIINRLLGYKVHFQLMEFSFNEATGRTYFYGLTRYEELGDKKRWIKNRRQTYKGSTLHFFKALLKDQLKEAGFDIYLVKKMSSGNAASAMSMAVPVTVKQILSIDTARPGFHRVTLADQLMVQYRFDNSTKLYLRKKMLIHGNLPTGFRSFIIPNTPFILIDQNGILANPMSIEYSGFWIYEKAASLLPYNYEPG